ncbi:hypothetical protein [Streptomyces sp. NRRL F-5123]|uniref:hypothetical protein n=1 Tax=Streptomyces sp. NRRL F-5123 TaxID=1463856 RepID=UPI0004E2773C|nr:hypothetical protein [Streptomyces sp. NRRL F-5123]
MTYEVPPPPGPPAPPPNAGGRPGGSFDPASVNRLDWVILGAGALLFIFSFFAYESASANIMGAHYSQDWNAWNFDHGFFIAWFAMAIGVASAAVLALSLFVPTVSLPAAPRMITFVGFAVSFVLYVIAIFAHDDFGDIVSHAFGFWISLILAAVGAVVALMRAQQTNTALPGPLSGLPRIGN